MIAFAGTHLICADEWIYGLEHEIDRFLFHTSFNIARWEAGQ